MCEMHGTTFFDSETAFLAAALRGYLYYDRRTALCVCVCVWSSY